MEKKILATIIGITFGLWLVKSLAQVVPTSTISADCTTAYVSATNTDSGQWTSGEINRQIGVATQDEINLRQKLVQDDVTLGLYVPLQQAISACLSAQANSVNATNN